MTPLCFSLAAACGSREHTVVQKIPAFQRQREGSFRAWLRVVTVNRLREFWRAQQTRPIATGDSDFLRKLQELEDHHSPLARQWDSEHDRYVVGRLIQLFEPLFEPATRQAFRRVVLEGPPPSEGDWFTRLSRPGGAGKSN